MLTFIQRFFCFFVFRVFCTKVAIHNRLQCGMRLALLRKIKEKWTKFGSILNYLFRRCVNVPLLLLLVSLFRSVFGIFRRFFFALFLLFSFTFIRFHFHWRFRLMEVFFCFVLFVLSGQQRRNVDARADARALINRIIRYYKTICKRFLDCIKCTAGVSSWIIVTTKHDPINSPYFMLIQTTKRINFQMSIWNSHNEH